MTFEDYWKQVEETGILSRVAISFLPESLSDELKTSLGSEKSGKDRIDVSEGH